MFKKPHRNGAFFWLSIISLFLCANAHATALTASQRVELSELSQVPENYIEHALADVTVLSSVQQKIVKPWEAKPWHQYRELFLTEKRIANGKAFMQQHQALLAKAEAQFGVDKQFIAAILAVETNFGQNMGNDRVIDSLYTLAYHYPKSKNDRSAFFKKELAAFLTLSFQEQWPIASLKGSYAGAMGYGQFMPSSYQHYAVDFDGDGKRDLFNSVADAIGSIANYFAEHRWQHLAPVMQPLPHRSTNSQFMTGKLSADFSAKELCTANIACGQWPEQERGNVFGLVQVDGEQHYLGFRNFYVITRYNRSPLYAMAVYQLSRAFVGQDFNA